MKRLVCLSLFSVIIMLFLRCSVETFHDDADYSIMIIGDMRSGYTVYEKLLYIINVFDKDPVFLASLGDIVSTPGNEIEYHEYGVLNKKYIPDIPHYSIPGNHDVNDEESEQIYKEITKMPGNGLYYSVTHENVFCVFLDTEMPGAVNSIKGEQYSWLVDTLDAAQKDSGVTTILIFMHRPLYPQCEHLDRDFADADQLLALFKEHGKVKFVFAGHDHCFNALDLGGILQITSGGGGSPFRVKSDNYYHLIKAGFYRNSGRINIKAIDMWGDTIEDFDY